jgi:arylsulfatase A-like enzyme
VKQTNKFFKIIWLSLTLFLLFSCGKNTERFQVIRLIDRLSEKDIKETPLKNLSGRFPLQSESISGGNLKKVHLKGYENKTVRMFQLKYPVLYGKAGDTPPEMEVFHGGKEVEYISNTSQETQASYSLVKRERYIYLDKFLCKGESFDIELILPSGDVDIDLSANNLERKDYIPHLIMTLNDREIGDFYVDNKIKSLQVPDVDSGTYRLKILFDKEKCSVPLDERGLFCNLYYIRISSDRDVLLISSSQKNDTSSSLDHYDIRYRVDPTGIPSYLKKRPFLLDYFHIYQIQTNGALATDTLKVKKTPFSFKRKFFLRNGTVDVLFAPPSTEFGYRLKIPEDASLEFGMGLLSEYDLEENIRVNFQIYTEKGGEKSLIFNKVVGLEGEGKHLVLRQEKIDLKKLAGQRIRFTFVTEMRSPGKKSRPSRSALAFWSNPIIHTLGMQDKKKNIILISIDTLRADHLGSYGYSRNTSPNIDRLSSDSLQFNNAFSPSSWTLPAHMSLLTALNPSHHKVLLKKDKLNPSYVTLAEILRENGYITGAFTGGGFVDSSYGFSKGFDFYKEANVGQSNLAEMLYHNSFEWIKENQNKRFFLFLHTYQPHDPYSSPPPFNKTFLREEDRWERLSMTQYMEGIKGLYKEPKKGERENIIDLYDGEIRYTDETFIRPLMEGLKELNLYDQSLIILTSDHGEEFHDHGAWTHGYTLFNEMIQIPLLIKLPESRSAGEKMETYIRLIDIVPTILEELRIGVSKYHFDGKSLFPVIGNKEIENRTFIGELYSDEKFQSSIFPMNDHLRTATVNRGPYKLVVSVHSRRFDYFFTPQPPHRETIEVALFDIEKDPHEQANIAPKHPELVQELLKEIRSYYKKKNKQMDRPEDFRLDQDLTEKLRALGYIH